MKDITYKTKNLYICDLRVIASNSFKCYTKCGIAVCQKNFRGQYINVLTGERYWSHNAAMREGIIGQIFVRAAEYLPADFIREKPTMTKSEVETYLTENNGLNAETDNGVNLD